MAVVDFATAQAQAPLDLQVVQDDVNLTQNMDSLLEQQFSLAAGSDIGEQQYRHPIQFSMGGHTFSVGLDGGSLDKGIGPGYSEFIVAPVAVASGFSATKLMQDIAKGGKDVTVIDPVARMVTDAKTKHGHCRATYLQTYNNGVLGTVDPSYAGTNVVQMANAPHGGRLIDLNERYTITDSNLNVVDTVN